MFMYILIHKHFSVFGLRKIVLLMKNFFFLLSKKYLFFVRILHKIRFRTMSQIPRMFFIQLFINFQLHHSTLYIIVYILVAKQQQNFLGFFEN